MGGETLPDNTICTVGMSAGIVPFYVAIIKRPTDKVPHTLNMTEAEARRIRNFLCALLGTPTNKEIGELG